ncbi:LysR family transcriptional regulator [Bartonella sp. HY038]|uniref:LysR family transcriptional regulator n=1 Tax=Bartonella sp. HY038 TaxID=2759660 RepID=UPI0015F9FB28|nr:LysR family transcriptional regulator [Bartonella sp. HY038]
MKNIPLNLLNIFAISARLQSFKLAGEALLLTTSAVSQSTKKLEDLLGVRLFIRNSNSVELTAKGQALLSFVEAGLQEIEKGIDHITNKEHFITLFCPPGFANFLMQPIILELLEKGYEDIRLITNEEKDVLDIKNYDIAVFLDEKAAHISHALDLGPDYYYPFCHQNIYDKIKTIEDFKQFILIRNAFARTTWEEWLSFNHIPINITKSMTVNRASQLVSAIENGMGIGLESIRILSPKLKSGEFKLLEFDGLKPIIKHMTWLAIAPHNTHNKPINHIAQMIISQCSTDKDGILISSRSEHNGN